MVGPRFHLSTKPTLRRRSSLAAHRYVASKKLAEKAAYDLQKSSGATWSLSVRPLLHGSPATEARADPSSRRLRRSCHRVSSHSLPCVAVALTDEPSHDAVIYGPVVHDFGKLSKACPSVS